MDDALVALTWSNFAENHEVPEEITLATGETIQAKDLFMKWLLQYDKLKLGGDFEVEWGIDYVDEKVLPVEPIRNTQAAHGIFKAHGVPGDKLVKRVTGVWVTQEEKTE
jgi:hypothetical protein